MTQHDDIETVKRAADAQRPPQNRAESHERARMNTEALAAEAERGYAVGGIRPVERVVREREALLIDARNTIGGDRERDYGAVLPGFERIAAMWSAILGVTVTAEQYAMCQVATKLGRLAETPNHRDSWLDVAGYAALGAEVAATEGRYV